MKPPGSSLRRSTGRGKNDMLMNQSDYFDTVAEIKAEILKSQYNAVASVNHELVVLYYHIGKVINLHKAWGNKYIDNLSHDLKVAFPDSKGYSVRNLKYMSQFASMFPEEEFVQEALAQLERG